MPARSHPRPTCPVTGERGRAVPSITLESLLLPAVRARIGTSEWYFCASPDCAVVYFDGFGKSFDKQELSVRVGIKERAGPRPVCYCFDHTFESIAEEIRETGNSTVVDSITERIRAGDCECETLNPRGACCLGDVRAAVANTNATVEDVPHDEEPGDCCAGA